MAWDKDAQIKYDKMILDESKVPAYTLPSALEKPDGTIVGNAVEWQSSQRSYLLNLFALHMYGKVPPRPDCIEFKELSSKTDAFGGLATRKEIAINCMMNNKRSHTLCLLIYIPNHRRGPVPVFFGLNFQSNAACTTESDVMLSQLPHYNMSGPMMTDARATEGNRGAQACRWQFEKILKRGYAVGTMFYFDSFPDFPDGFKHSIYKLFYSDAELDSEEKDFGAIGAWAWSISRALDYFETNPAIDSRKIIIHGHSRLGKTALWAGASDPRPALVISNCSGCGGAALSRRNFGESLEWLLHWRKYWFAKKWQSYIEKESLQPFDQHALISLIAPRLVYVASATEDAYADPRGEFLSAFAAGDVYRLFGSSGLGTALMPSADISIGNDIAYHIRTGKHDITEFDWECYLNFADRKLKKSNKFRC